MDLLKLKAISYGNYKLAVRYEADTEGELPIFFKSSLRITGGNYVKITAQDFERLGNYSSATILSFETKERKNLLLRIEDIISQIEVKRKKAEYSDTENLDEMEVHFNLNLKSENATEELAEETFFIPRNKDKVFLNLDVNEMVFNKAVRKAYENLKNELKTVFLLKIVYQIFCEKIRNALSR